MLPLSGSPYGYSGEWQESILNHAVSRAVCKIFCRLMKFRLVSLSSKISVLFVLTQYIVIDIINMHNILYIHV